MVRLGETTCVKVGKVVIGRYHEIKNFRPLHGVRVFLYYIKPML